MSKVLSSEQIQQYMTQGFHFPVKVLNQSEAEFFRAQVERLQDHLGGVPKPWLTSQCHLNFRWAYDLCTHPTILDAVEDIIGPDILVHSSSIFCKHPQDGNYVSWHQDSFYWRLSNPRLVSAWIALGESSIANGCMRVIPGSHREGFDHQEKPDHLNMLGSGSTVGIEVDETTAVDLVLRPGEMSLHHANAIHGSKQNLTKEKRIGFAIRYVAPEVKQATGHHEVLLARGTDRCHHYQVRRDLPSDDFQEGLTAQTDFAAWLQRFRQSQGRPNG